MKRLLVLLPLVGGCGLFSSVGGTYLLNFKFVSSDCDSGLDATTDATFSAYAEVAELEGDNVGVSIEGDSLAGPRDGDSFKASNEDGETSSSAGCTSTYNYAILMNGTFTGDLGLEGDLSLSMTADTSGCGKKDYSYSCTQKYTYSGFMVQDEEPYVGGAQTGNLPGGGYF